MLPGLDRDERGERDALVAAAGHCHHRGGAAPAPGTSFRRSQGPGQIRLRRRSRRPGPPRSFYHGPGLLPPGGDRRLVPLGGPPRRDLDAPADPVQQRVHAGQRVLRPEPAAHHLRNPRQRPALVLIPAPGRRPGVQQRRQFAQLGRAQLALRAARALRHERRAASARRHRFADIRDTRKCRAQLRSLAPPRLIPRLPAAHAPGGPAQPRPARHHPGYLMTLAYRTTRQPSPGVTPAIEDRFRRRSILPEAFAAR